MSDAADKNDFKTKLAAILSAFDERQADDAVQPYAGVEDPDPLEHTTRILLLDEIIKALGWRLAGGCDVAEEARVQAETTHFIDYLGVDPNRRIPLLIIEAKAWNKPFVTPRDRRIQGEPHELILRAIKHIREGGDALRSPVTAEWHDWLTQIRGYVQDLLDQHGHYVERVVITSGRWMVIFTNPASTFCSNEPLQEDQLMVVVKNKFVEQSDDIFELLSRKRLIKSVPPLIRVTQLAAFVRADDLSGVFHSLIVKREESGHSWMKILPQIHVYPSIILLRRDGQLITVNRRPDPFTFPHSDDETVLRGHLRDVETEAQTLLQAVSAELRTTLTPSSLREFPGFSARPRSMAAIAASVGSPGAPATIYLDRGASRPEESLVATGNTTHFLLPQPTLVCRFHDWATCRANEMAVDANAITVRSTNPRSFFKSGENHHCAHQEMHDRRSQLCKIDPIDRYLCCMACSFQSLCWPTGHAIPLPCGRL